MIGFKNLSKQRALYMLLFFVLFFICFQRLFFFSSGILESISSYLIYPVLVVQNKISSKMKSVFEKSGTVEQLTAQIEKLKQENEDLLADNIQVKSSLRYLENLEELIEFKKQYEVASFLPASILMRQISQDGNILFIDQGSSAGIKKDMVVVYKNCLLGKITEVYPTYSKFAAITDKSCKVAVCCIKSSATGIHEGCNKIDKTKLSHVNHLDQMFEDDLVISSGEGLVFPKGFALGKVSQFTKDGIQYKVDIQPIINISKISHCFVIRK